MKLLVSELSFDGAMHRTTMGDRYWAAHYFIDSRGLIRGRHYGEGQYDEPEQVVRQRRMTAIGPQRYWKPRYPTIYDTI
jgi:hypothetical protein